MLSKKLSQTQCRGIKKKFLSIEILFSIIFSGSKVGVLFNCNMDSIKTDVALVYS
jgi:hypothetical protein